MIIVTVSIVPADAPMLSKEVGRISIVNDGTGDQDQADYYVNHQTEIGGPRIIWIRGHRRAEGIWKLLKLVMNALVPQ
jgi:hypothetical protein